MLVNEDKGIAFIYEHNNLIIIALLLYLTTMTYPQDFHITYSQIEKGEHAIDSYALLQSIIDETEEGFQFSLDNSLPIIMGDELSVKGILIKFIENSISNFKGNIGTLYISYRKDLDSSFLAYFIDSLRFEKDECSNLIDSISDFNLAICKKTVNEIESIANTHFHTNQLILN